MTTKYDLTESAKSTKNNVFNSIINELENGPGQFTENLENLKGVLYTLQVSHVTESTFFDSLFVL